jgi:hypothetical protein
MPFTASFHFDSFGKYLQFLRLSVDLDCKSSINSKDYTNEDNYYNELYCAIKTDSVTADDLSILPNAKSDIRYILESKVEPEIECIESELADTYEPSHPTYAELEKELVDLMATNKKIEKLLADLE